MQGEFCFHQKLYNHCFIGLHDCDKLHFRLCIFISISNSTFELLFWSLVSLTNTFVIINEIVYTVERFSKCKNNCSFHLCFVGYNGSFV